MRIYAYFSFIVFFIACKSKPNVLPIVKQDIFEEVGTNVHVMYSDSALLKVEMTADTMIRNLESTEKKDVFRGNVHIFFYDEKGNIMGNVTCGKATRLQKDYTFLLEEKVVLTNPFGEKMESSHLIYLEKENKAYSNRFCKITRREEIVEGFEFEASKNFEKFSLKYMTGKISLANPNLNN